MPCVAAERLHRIGSALLVAAGSPSEEAEVVMRHCIDANLAGHDSHGIIQIPTYIDRIQVGHIDHGLQTAEDFVDTKAGELKDWAGDTVSNLADKIPTPDLPDLNPF